MPGYEANSVNDVINSERCTSIALLLLASLPLASSSLLAGSPTSDEEVFPEPSLGAAERMNTHHRLLSGGCDQLLSY